MSQKFRKYIALQTNGWSLNWYKPSDEHIDEKKFQFNTIESLSRVGLFATRWNEACQASLSITNSWSLFKHVSIEPVMPSSVVLFSSCLQSFTASGSFRMSQFLGQVAKALEFQLQHQSSQWIFRTDFL